MPTEITHDDEVIIPKVCMPQPIFNDIEDADFLIRKRRFRSGLKLIHTLIEEMAYIIATRHKKDNNAHDYKRFVDEYVLPHYGRPDKPTSDELYVSRNGFIHSTTLRGQRASARMRTISWTYEGCEVHSYVTPFATHHESHTSLSVDLKCFWYACETGICGFFRSIDTSERKRIKRLLKGQAVFLRTSTRAERGLYVAKPHPECESVPDDARANKLYIEMPPFWVHVTKMQRNRRTPKED